MFERLEACQPDGMVLRATRADGSMQIVDQDSRDQLLSRAHSGEFGDIEPYQPPAPSGQGATGASPPIVEAWQMKVHLSRVNMLTTVSAQMALNEEHNIIWTSASVFKRSGPVADALSALGQSDAQIDAAFTAAGEIDQ